MAVSYLEDEVNASNQPLTESADELTFDRKEQRPKGVANFVLDTIPKYAIRGTEAAIQGTVEGIGNTILHGSLDEGLKAAKTSVKDTLAGRGEGFSETYIDSWRAFKQGFGFGYGPSPSQPQDRNFPERLMVQTAGAGGYVMSLLGIGKLTKGVTTLAGAGKLVNKWPRAGKYATALIDNVSAMVARGQLDKSLVDRGFKERMQQMGRDAEMGALFTGLGVGIQGLRGLAAKTPLGPTAQRVATGVAEYPTMFTVGYLEAGRDPNATEEDRIMAGLVFVGLHGAMDLADRPVGLRGVKKPKTPSPAEVRQVTERVRDAVVETEALKTEGQRRIDTLDPKFSVSDSQSATQYGKSVGRAMGFPDGVLALTDITITSGKTSGLKFDAKNGRNKIFIPESMSSVDAKAAITKHMTELQQTRPMTGEERPTFTKEQIEAGEVPKELRTEFDRPEQIEFQEVGSLLKSRGIESEMTSDFFEVMTGKRSTKEMTKRDLDTMTDALKLMEEKSVILSDPGLRDLFIGDYITPMKQIALDFEAKSGVPLYTDVYRPLRLADTYRNQFLIKTDKMVLEAIGPEVAKDVVARERVGKLVDLVQEPGSPAGRRLAKELGMSEAEIQAASNLRAHFDQLLGVGQEAGFDVRFRKNYLPKIRKAGSVDKAFGENIPQELEFFAEFERIGNLDTGRIFDPITLSRIYSRALSRKLYYQDALTRYNEIKGELTPNLRKRADDYMDQNLGRRDPAGDRMQAGFKAVDEVIGKMFGGKVKSDLAGSHRHIQDLFFTTGYSGPLGFNAQAVGLQFLQPLQFGIAEFGPKGSRFIIEGYGRGLDPKAWELAEKKGWIRDDLPADRAIRAYDSYGRGKARKVSGALLEFEKAALWGFKKGDAYARVVTGTAAMKWWENAAAKHNIQTTTKDGQVVIHKSTSEQREAFYDAVDLATLPGPVQESIKRSVERGKMEMARDEFIEDRLDATQFAQTPGEFMSGQNLGLGGRSTYMFQSYPLQSLNTVTKRWAKNPEKLSAFIATSAVLVQGMRKVGVDLSNQLGATNILQILEFQLIPLRIAQSVGTMVDAMMTPENEAFVADAAQKMADTMRLFQFHFVKGSIMRNKIDKFIMSAENGWMAFDAKGMPLFQSIPKDVVLRLVGFKPISDARFQKLREKGANLRRLDAQNIAKLRSWYALGEDERATEFLEKNPEYYEVIAKESFWEYIVTTKAARLDEGIPDRLLNEWLDVLEDVDRKFGTDVLQ